MPGCETAPRVAYAHKRTTELTDVSRCQANLKAMHGVGSSNVG